MCGQGFPYRWRLTERYLRKVVVAMRFLLETFISLLTFRFEIVEPTVTLEEAKQLKELIESQMNKNTALEYMDQ